MVIILYYKRYRNTQTQVSQVPNIRSRNSNNLSRDTHKLYILANAKPIAPPDAHFRRPAENKNIICPFKLNLGINYNFSILTINLITTYRSIGITCHLP